MVGFCVVSCGTNNSKGEVVNRPVALDSPQVSGKPQGYVDVIVDTLYRKIGECVKYCHVGGREMC